MTGGGDGSDSAESWPGSSVASVRLKTNGSQWVGIAAWKKAMPNPVMAMVVRTESFIYSLSLPLNHSRPLTGKHQKTRSRQCLRSSAKKLDDRYPAANAAPPGRFADRRLGQPVCATKKPLFPKRVCALDLANALIDLREVESRRDMAGAFRDVPSLGLLGSRE